MHEAVQHDAQANEKGPVGTSDIAAGFDVAANAMGKDRLPAQDRSSPASANRKRVIAAL
jgi:hypothetical protein